jgi:nitrite reductase/ring-hydroxylating ferredoxin subunit
MPMVSPAPAGSGAPEPQIITKEPYFSRAFMELEKERLWPKVWLLVCRENEVAGTGQFVTFDVADESIIVVRDHGGTLRAFFNVCQHRGRRLLAGTGRAGKIFCKYHGWRWNTDGSNDVIVDEGDWGGTICKKDVALKALKVDTWGGWVFVHMDAANAEPLNEWLKPFNEAFRNYKFEDFGVRWHRQVTLPCNWKVALDVFIEGYHAPTAHRQFNPVGGDNRWTCKVHGVHSMFNYRGMPIIGEPCENVHILPAFAEDEQIFQKATDLRHKIHAYFDMLNRDTDALITDRRVRATKRLTEEVPADASYEQIMMAMDRFLREEGRKDGINWDNFTFEDLSMTGMDWHMFPNIALLPTEDGALMYRARPNGDDPDSCIYDIWSLERSPPGKAQTAPVQVINHWRDIQWPRIFVQDFENLAELQAGIKSRGFRGGLANPIAELTCINFHKHVRQYVLGEE